MTSRMDSRKVIQALADLERHFDPVQDSTAGQDALRKCAGRTGPPIPQPRPGYLRPTDVLRAIPMLQVGVDVKRLGPSSRGLAWHAS